MRVLVTGSDGFIASRITPGLDDWMGIDLASGSDVASEHTAENVRAFDPEIVYHLAAHHYIPWCDAHPDETIHSNLIGTENLLRALGPSLQAFVFASSAAVYGFSDQHLPETSKLAGRGVYAWTKQAGESWLQLHAEERPQARFVAARLFNVVGHGDHTDHVLPGIVNRVLDDKPVEIGNDWPKRDYVHVADVADALRFLATAAPAGFSAYNVGTGLGTTVGAVLAEVCRVTGTPVSVRKRLERQRPQDGHLVSDPTKLAQLGWEARRTLGDAIADILGKDEAA